MAAAAGISEKMGLLKSEDRKRIEALLIKMKLPVNIPADRDKLLYAMNRDKKREGGSIHMVLIKKIGEAVIERISIEDLESLMV